MAFTPVEFAKGGRTKVAETPGEYYQLIWDGWITDGTPAPPAPVFSQAQEDALNAAFAKRIPQYATQTDAETGLANGEFADGDLIIITGS